MPYSESSSPVKRLSNADRSASHSSVTKPSPPTKPKGHRAHLAGHGRIHTRNPSYGKNLNKLTKLADDDATLASRAAKTKTTSPTSPALGHMKRNSSTISLPRTGSKVSIARNSSNVSLKRNSSHAQIQKGQRPPTPLRKNHSRSDDLDKLGQPREARFILDNDDEEPMEDHDDDWTEESASQSPSVTRQSSTSKRPSGKSTPDKEAPSTARPHPPHLRSLSPPPDTASEDRSSRSDYVAVTHPTDYTSRPPDAEALTSRLLNRQTSYQLPPQVSSISATGTPGMHTPPNGSQIGEQPVNSSLSDHGVSRFIGAPSSSGTGSYHLNGIPGSLQRQPSYSGTSSIRSSPPSGDPDNLRRTKSSSNLNSSTRPTVTLDAQTPDEHGGTGKPAVRSYTFQPANQRRGNFTQVRMELWRNQTTIEPSHVPPAPIISRLPVAELGVEERRVRQWEEAETQIGHLKRFRNPLLEGTRRALRRYKLQLEQPSGAGDGGGNDAPRSGKTHRSKNHRNEESSGANATASGAGHQARERGRPQEPRTSISHMSRRSVRFEVGLDGGEEMTGEETDSGPDGGIDALLRSLWSGGDTDMSGEV